MAGAGSPLRVSRAAARRFLAERHLLLPPRQLPASRGSVLALVERLGSLQDGRAVEFSQSYYRGDMYDFVAELSAQ